MSESFVVIDFETTGLDPSTGDRVTEVAAIKVHQDRVVDSYQSLIKTGAYISKDIENLTGITNQMVETAPTAVIVMARLAVFLESFPLVAHNVAFDAKFLDAEFSKARINRVNNFACSMKLARRVYPNAPNYKLVTLLDYADIPIPSRLHRAMADATATLSLWQQMKRDMLVKKGIQEITFNEMQLISTTRHR